VPLPETMAFRASNSSQALAILWKFCGKILPFGGIVKINLFFSLIPLLISTLAWAGRPFQVEDMQKIKRITEHQISPDGKWIVFAIRESDIAKNKGITNLWLMTSDGTNQQQLTFADKGSNSRPRWSPDSRFLYFLSTRIDDTSQVFRLQLGGGEAKQITKVVTGIDSYVLSPDGKTIAFTTTVFPECTDLACNEKKDKEVAENPVKVRIITEVPFRRWDAWVDGKRIHICVIPAEGGDAKDITPGDVDSPIWTEGGGEEIAFSPDSKEIAFSRYTENEALTNNSDIYTIPVTGGTVKQITTNKAADTTPLYSPDGRYIAYTALLRPTEADTARLFVYDKQAGTHTNLTERLDRNVQAYSWTPDSKSFLLIIEDQGLSPIMKMEINRKEMELLYGEGTNTDLQLSNDGKFVTFEHMDISHPVDIYRINLNIPGKQVYLTNLNQDLFKDIELGEYSSFNFVGWNQDSVQSWLVKPPFFDPNKKYPLLLLMHGGPESAWGNSFHYRWNMQLFAAAGYVVIAPNFHGSTGFGLKFMDAIKGQWGGAPYEDQMKAVDVALTWPYVDSTRISAAGASYGGYMANWVAGQTDRFRTIVNHDGLYDLLSSLYSSDFIGGLDKEFKGTAYLNQQALIDQAPVTHAKNFKTPMLVIHGEKDYRVDPSNGYATFQVLQAMGIPSKLIVFPEENHWILKPADSILWYKQVLGWLDQWTKPEKSEYDKMLKGK
jgi:dipeptidyl aminopeptidase/acylaminoacyl peptidase